jgi:RND superfamily putative drug exporter
MRRLSEFVVRHRWYTVGFWLLTMAASVVAVQRLDSLLSSDLAMPGLPAYEANKQIVTQYGNGGDSPPAVPVITLPAGVTVDSPQARDALSRGFQAVARIPSLRVCSYADTGDRRFVSSDGRTTFGLVFTNTIFAPGTVDLAPQISDALTRALPAGTTVRVTGVNQLSLSGGGGGPGVLAETLLGALGALAVLAFVFGSLLALLPLVMAAVSILTTLLLVAGLAEITPISAIVDFIVALIGLGVSIDYSLLVVTRWREERARGYTGPEAVHRAMASAGRAVLVSGLTVTVGLVSMVVLPVPFLRGIGYAGMLIPVVSVAVVLTLLPVMLATIGPRVDWPRLRKEDAPSRGWTSWARGIIRYRWVAAVAAIVALVVLGLAAFQLRLGQPAPDSLAKSGPAYEGLRTLETDGLFVGVLTPIEVYVPAGMDPAALAGQLSQVPGVYVAIAPEGGAWRRHGSAMLDVLPVAETSGTAGKATVDRVRDRLAALAPAARAGGAGAQDIDFGHAVYGRFPLMLAIIAIVTFALLARAFRSMALPVKAVVLNLLSLGAVYGAVVLVWQQGYGSRAIWGIPATGSITTFVPLMVFAFLYGLSMDYEVFILARVREEYDRTGSTEAAIVEGIGRTGRLVTSAAVILFLAFASLASAPVTDIKIFATALGLGILIDATVIRALLVPALLALLGSRTWWLPRGLARLLVVRALPASSGPEQAGTPDERELATRTG